MSLGSQVRGDGVALSVQSGDPTATLEPVAQVRAEADGARFASASDTFLSTLGLNPTQVLGQRLEDVFCPEGARAIDDLIRRCEAAGSSVRAADVECALPGLLPLDVSAQPVGSPAERRVELVLHRTATTDAALRELVGSLFLPSSERTASMVYVNELATQEMRAIHNNLTSQIGLPNTFTLKELHAVEHPDDHRRQQDFNARRAALGDGDHLTWSARVRDTSGGWRTLNARARVFSRNPDGTPSRMLAVCFDSSAFETVYDALLKVTADLARTEAQERERLGRELHDAVSQPLVGAQLTLSLLRRGRVDEREALQLDEVSRSIGEALEQIRTLSFLLHPPDLESLGLTGALQGLCDGFSRRTKLPVLCGFEDDLDRQQGPVAMTLFRITQEALMNVHRHAHASRAEVRLSRSRGRLQLEVADDGIGIAGITNTGPSPAFAGVGIAGMRARMTNLGGELLLSNRNPGLQVLARLPTPPL